MPQLSPAKQSTPFIISPQEDRLNAFSAGFIEQLPLFRDLTPPQIEAARNVIAPRRLDSETLLMREDQAGDHIFLLIEGSVKIYVTKGENEVVLGLRGRGEIIGELSILDGAARSASVFSQTPCVVGVISRFDFWNVLWEMPPVPYNVACLLAERVRRLTARLQAMATLDVRSRLAFQLATMVAEHAVINKNGHYEIPFTFTQNDLAHMVGTSRVQANQSLAAWKRASVIEIHHQRIVVCKLEALHDSFPAALFVAPSHPAKPFDFNAHFGV